MRTIPRVLLLTLFVVLCVDFSESARILAAIPTPSYSHQIVYHRLWKTLSMRGHEIVLITTNPELNAGLPNITFVDIGNFYDKLRKYDFVRLRFEDTSWLTLMETRLLDTFNEFGEQIFDQPEMRKLYAADNKQKFDVFITETLYTPCLYALGHRFDIPVIGMTSLGLSWVNTYQQGLPILPSHLSSWESEDAAKPNLPFWRRVMIFIRLWYHVFHVYRNFIPKQEKIIEQHLGKGYPSITELSKNLSLIFVHQRDALSYVRPTLSKIINFGFTHISDDRPQLSNELKNFLDNATNGFIYFSLGTNVRTSSFSDENRQIFCEVFKTLPYKVLWKYDKNMPDISDNVLIKKWLPQQAVLAHPNIKLFIYQGGYQSTEEAVYYGVPLIGLPILADQDYQVNRMVSLGVARRLDIHNIDRELFKEAINDVLTDKRYKEQMLKLSNLVKDEPNDQVDKLVWWIEFVIRHRGTPHLQCSIADEPWYRRYDIDIIAFLSIVAFIGCLCVFVICYKFVIALSNCNARSHNLEEKKRN